MNTPILFMVHGMGRYADNWADSTINELNSRFQRYQAREGKKKFAGLVYVRSTR